MDKNIAAILREDAKTVHVQFYSGNKLGREAYKYITHFQLNVGDVVVIPVGESAKLAIAEVVMVDDDLEIEPNSDIKYKWVVGVVDTAAAQENMERNAEIESMLAATYRNNARQAYAQQFLSGADPKVLELVKGKS